MARIEPTDEEVIAATVWWPPILPLKAGEKLPLPQPVEEDPHPPMRGCCCDECVQYFDRKDEAPADGLIYEQKESQNGNEIDGLAVILGCGVAGMDVVSATLSGRYD